jgi:hypothetical protein
MRHMDESAFRHAKGEVNRLPCVFKRALLAHQAVCEFAVQQTVSGREGIACAQPVARASCGELHGLLQEKSVFALRRGNTKLTSPASQVLQLQCGGLNGLRDVIDPGAPAPNIHVLVRSAQERYAELAQLPFSEIVKAVAAWKPARPSGKPNR